jgi:hypothetical protein
MLIEKYKIIQAFEPKTTNTAIKSGYVDLKNSITAVAVINLNQAVAHETEISLYQAQDTKGTGAKPLENNIPIWVNEDVSIGDSAIRLEDGVNYTVQKTAKNKQIIFSVDPAKIDVNNGFCCLGLKIGASSQATNFACGEFLLDMKYSN